MSHVVPPLYAITDVQLSGLSHAQQVAALCAGGATLIQLREKVLSPHEFYSQAEEAVRVGHSYDAKVLINDRVDIALAVSADGVHLGQEDLSPAAARSLLGDRAIIGYSTHNARQAVAALETRIDYVAVGPVFPTKTKQNSDPEVGLSLLREIKRMVGTMPVVAIGGISIENAREVFDTGADSVAVISWLISNKLEIEKRARQFVSTFPSQVKRQT
jgi:thiamine-phosphate pyrophosphorylase